MKTIGLDIGSSATKAVLFEDGEVLAAVVRDSVPDMAAAASMAVETLAAPGVPVLSTGYGRTLYPDRMGDVTEITALAAGVGLLLPEARTVVDIGGQDSKAVRVEAGRVVDFAMNDRCAAGTGRFLEVMGRVLGVPLDRLDETVGEGLPGVAITSMCTVFAETEVVGLMSRRVPTPEILRGLLAGIAGRVAGLARQMGVIAPVAATGGPLRSNAMAAALARAMGVQVVRPPEPQMVTAMGAAFLCARRSAQAGACAHR